MSSVIPCPLSGPVALVTNMCSPCGLVSLGGNGPSGPDGPPVGNHFLTSCCTEFLHIQFPFVLFKL